MNILIENGEAIRLSITDVLITTVLIEPKTGKHVLFTSSRKGKTGMHELPEGTSVTIHVDKSKEPKTISNETIDHNDKYDYDKRD